MPMKVNIDKERNVLVISDWHDLIKTYKDLAKHGNIPKEHILKGYTNPDNGHWRKSGRRNKWTGADFDTMISWMNNGYEFQGKLGNLNLPVETTSKRRLRYTDDPEGDLDYDSYLNGECEYYQSKPRRENKMGINLRLNYCFSAATDQKVIAEYAKWIGEVIHHLQSRGYDLQIELYSECTGTYHNTRQCEHRIVMSKFGTRAMPRDWSALFSPGGYRHLMFLVYMWPGEITELTPESGLGMPPMRDWGVIWEPEKRVIKVQGSAMTREFPSEKMTKELEGLKYE